MLAPQKPSPGSDERHVKIRILRCVEQGVCCQEVLKAMAYTDNLDVLDTEAAYAITEFFWRQIQSMYLFDFLVEFVYLVLLMIASYDVTRGQALRPGLWSGMVCLTLKTCVHEASRVYARLFGGDASLWHELSRKKRLGHAE